MGKGDKKSKRGKIAKGSHGRLRPQPEKKEHSKIIREEKPKVEK